jgi:hypothetical protein
MLDKMTICATGWNQRSGECESTVTSQEQHCVKVQVRRAGFSMVESTL